MHGVLTSTLENWSATQLRYTQNTAIDGTLIPLKGDASTRRYYRIRGHNQKSYIVVYAPPETEKNQQFINIAKNWLVQGIHAPVIFSVNLEQGFMLLEDFGVHTLLDVLKQRPKKCNELYQQAMSVLHRIQIIQPATDFSLPRFDRTKMLKEMVLFDQWIATACLAMPCAGNQKKAVDLALNFVIDSALEQPYVTVHRDYHSRNIMPVKNNLGILDFQDAVTGPVTYDIVSLLRDCYIDWSVSRVYQWLSEFVSYTPSLKKVPQSTLNRWFDLMGLQRHLKAAGIFMRQWILNGNDFYLPDIPRVFSYIDYVCSLYKPLQPLKTWIEQTILPGLQAQPWWQPHTLKE